MKQAKLISKSINEFKESLFYLRELINAASIGEDRALDGELTRLDKLLDKTWDNVNKEKVALDNGIQAWESKPINQENK